MSDPVPAPATSLAAMRDQLQALLVAAQAKISEEEAAFARAEAAVRRSRQEVRALTDALAALSDDGVGARAARPLHRNSRPTSFRSLLLDVFKREPQRVFTRKELMELMRPCRAEMSALQIGRRVGTALGELEGLSPRLVQRIAMARYRYPVELTEPLAATPSGPSATLPEPSPAATAATPAGLDVSA